MNTVVKISSLKRSWYKKLPANKTTVLFLSMVYVTFYLKPIYYCYNLDTSNNPPPALHSALFLGDICAPKIKCITRGTCVLEEQCAVVFSRHLKAWETELQNTCHEYCTVYEAGFYYHHIMDFWYLNFYYYLIIIIKCNMSVMCLVYSHLYSVIFYH